MNLKKKLAVAIAALSIIPSVAFAETSITINLPAHTLSLYQDGQKIGVYPVAIGKYSTPTPTGEFSILNMEVDPIWTDPETMESVESGDWNPLGYRWMGFYGRYGIHGNSNPDSIGSSVSNGCVRMYNEDVENIFEIVDYGTPVNIIYDRAFIEKSGDDYVLYVYPDCYDEQDLDENDIKNMIAKYAEGATLTDAEIAQALEDEDGEPVYLASAVKVFVAGKEISAKGRKKGEMVALPTKAIAKELGIEIKWDGKKISTYKGSMEGYVANDEIYIEHWEDFEKVFPARVMTDKTTGNYYIIKYEEKALPQQVQENKPQTTTEDKKQTNKTKPQDKQSEKEPRIPLNTQIR